MNQKLSLRVATRIREIRIQAGLTQEAVALKAGIATSSYSRIERGARSNIKLDTLSRILDALGVGFESLNASDDDATSKSEISDELSLLVRDLMKISKDAQALRALRGIMKYMLSTIPTPDRTDNERIK